MIDISVKGLVKAFDLEKNILDGLSFEVNSGERIGILGVNGAGKTTLFKLLTGELSPDEGEIIVAGGKRLGLISQIPEYPPAYTVEDVLRCAHEELLRVRDRLELLAMQMAEENAPREIFSEYDRLTALFEARGGYDMETERNKVANGLEISAKMRGQLFSELSGGERTRVNLARLILEDTDILLLDEPTNHLDLRATEWLEDYLLHFRGTVLVISHDRWFLDRVVQRCMELVGGKAEFYGGNYSFFVEEKQRRYEEALRKYEKDQAKLKQLQEAADKLHLWAFLGNDKLHKRAFSMEKRMEKLETTERPKTEKALRARFGEKEFFGDEVLVIKGLSKGYEGRTLFSDLELELRPGERIALIGDNGCGKSTFLRLIMGLETPDSGLIKRGPTVKIAYLQQMVEFSNPERNLLDTMIYDANCTPQSARDRLGAFRFSGEDVFKSVSALSGGEKSRLRLCMLMKDSINLLILDEPTNHLDISSREWIEAAVADYGEALLFVSHDRYFIDRFATRIWELKDQTITDFRGTFAEYNAYKERTRTVTQIQRKNEAKKHEPRKKGGASPEKQLAAAEKRIAALEASLAALEAQCEEFSSDYQKLMEFGEQRDTLQAELDTLYEDWEALAQCIEEASEKQNG